MTDQPQAPDGPPTAERPPTYEAARQRLIEVVQTLESGSVPLSSAMELWHEGESLARQCQQWLDGARESIDQALRDETAQSTDH